MTSKLKGFFQPVVTSNFVSVALLVLRIIFGVAMMYHGWSKIQSPFSWMPASSGVPSVLQFLAALSEFGGGLALVIGLLVPLAMFGLSVTMLVAVYMHAIVMQDPFVSMTGGKSYELAAIFFGIAFFLMVHGPGRISLDRMIFGERKSK